MTRLFSRIQMNYISQKNIRFAVRNIFLNIQSDSTFSTKRLVLTVLMLRSLVQSEDLKKQHQGRQLFFCAFTILVARYEHPGLFLQLSTQPSFLLAHQPLEHHHQKDMRGVTLCSHTSAPIYTQKNHRKNSREQFFFFFLLAALSYCFLLHM